LQRCHRIVAVAVGGERKTLVTRRGDYRLCPHAGDREDRKSWRRIMNGEFKTALVAYESMFGHTELARLLQ
jgi:hypothetical protein